MSSQCGRLQKQLNRRPRYTCTEKRLVTSGSRVRRLLRSKCSCRLTSSARARVRAVCVCDWRTCRGRREQVGEQAAAVSSITERVGIQGAAVSERAPHSQLLVVPVRLQRLGVHTELRRGARTHTGSRGPARCPAPPRPSGAPACQPPAAPRRHTARCRGAALAQLLDQAAQRSAMRCTTPPYCSQPGEPLIYRLSSPEVTLATCCRRGRRQYALAALGRT